MSELATDRGTEASPSRWRSRRWQAAVAAAFLAAVVAGQWMGVIPGLSGANAGFRTAGYACEFGRRFPADGLLTDIEATQGTDASSAVLRDAIRQVAPYDISVVGGFPELGWRAAYKTDDEALFLAPPPKASLFAQTYVAVYATRSAGHWSTTASTCSPNPGDGAYQSREWYAMGPISPETRKLKLSVAYDDATCGTLVAPSVQYRRDMIIVTYWEKISTGCFPPDNLLATELTLSEPIGSRALLSGAWLPLHPPQLSKESEADGTWAP